MVLTIYKLIQQISILMEGALRYAGEAELGNIERVSEGGSKYSLNIFKGGGLLNFLMNYFKKCFQFRLIYHFRAN